MLASFRAESQPGCLAWWNFLGGISLERERREDDTSDRTVSIRFRWDCNDVRVGEFLNIAERWDFEGRVYLESITSLGVLDQFRGEKREHRVGGVVEEEEGGGRLADRLAKTRRCSELFRG